MDNRYKDGQKNWFGGDRIENLPRHIAMLKLNYERGKFSSYCRRKNKISIWKNKTSIKVEILFFYKP